MMRMSPCASFHNDQAQKLFLCVLRCLTDEACANLGGDTESRGIRIRHQGSALGIRDWALGIRH